MVRRSLFAACILALGGCNASLPSTETQSEDVAVTSSAESTGEAVSPPAASIEPASGRLEPRRLFAAADRTLSEEIARSRRPFRLTTAIPREETTWSYQGMSGPERWAELDPSFTTCGSGRAQSPVDLGTAVRSAHEELTFHYRPTTATVRDDGHTIRASLQPGSRLEARGMRYELLQFHLHGPSEHRVQGHAAAMEVHLVHRNHLGRLAVVGVLVEEGDAHPLLRELAHKAPFAVGGASETSMRIDLRDLLPEGRDYYRYVGSLTTPPCTEGVAWLVMEQPLQASAADIHALTASMPPRNARPVQALNGRAVTID